MATGTQHEQRETRRRDLNLVAPLLVMLFAATAMLIHTSAARGGTPRMGVAWTCVIVVITAAAALACNRIAIRMAVLRNTGMAVWTLLAGVGLAAWAGVAAAGPTGGDRPALTAVFCAAGMIVADTALVFPNATDPALRGVASTLAATALMLAICSAGTILADLPASILAGGVAAAGVCAIQLMPNIVVHVPDRYLVEWRTYMTRRWTVRGSIPDEARVLTPKDVSEDMRSFLARYAAGLSLAVTLAASAYLALAAWMDHGALLDRIGFHTLSLTLSLFLTLKPRQSGRPFERYLMRAAALLVAAVWLAHIRQTLPVAGGVTPFAGMAAFAVVGMLVGYGMLAQRGGFHSLALSRIGDALCFASTMLTPAAALLAAGTFELLRGMPW
ncbi:hypothetical protein [Bifidobacterium saguinibicoloris]|uniref:hypothetical protein n=1 Tax=Bifidobacterium saguinibicoloris TaxID=2834433 RepID=UPI001C59B035|nr:hypothetical protein [Bifidobacterium saguinibicoloris]MBW3081126.1 hypothetical protein [Bifidobacterium saguinibicoloris]